MSPTPPRPSAPPLSLKPTHAPVRAYYTALAQLANVGATHESAVREAWHRLIEHCAGPLKWTLVRDYSVSRGKGSAPLRLDAVLLDAYRIPHGVIEDKDDADDLVAEMRAKLKLGYPGKNTLFWQPRRALLVQDGKVVLERDLDTEPEQLCEILQAFFAYTEPVIADWERATEEFRGRVAELGRSLREVIQRERGIVGTVPNKKFVAAFDDFAALCRAAINPGLRDEAIEEMLIQHLLTARLFGSVFNNPDFTRRNVVAVEIEKVIDALASKHFTRDAFLKKLDPFYLAIENAATVIEDFSEKQKFLNTVYEKFFQGFAVKVADTMGIVYTPPSIVRFMIASIRELLQKAFGKDLGDPGVHVLDPFTGTGNFLVHLMRELPAKALKQKFASELWANEIMLLPYYIAAQNIEHEYFEKTGTYEAFNGLCLVDTFELAEPQRQTEMAFLSAANTERVNAQRRAPVFVVIGNPPYRGTQKNENDNNKNRKYPTLDERVAETYVHASKATLRNKVAGDPYIRALRWSSDRIGEHGIVSLVIPHSWIRKNSFDGVRAHVAQDFDQVYVVDLGGSVIDNPKLSGSTHNVFGIPMGVCIAHFVRKPRGQAPRNAVIEYFAVTDDWRKEKKLNWLETARNVSRVPWTRLKPDAKNTWLTMGLKDDFEGFLGLGNKETKALDSLDAHAIFRTYSLGVSTNRDSVVYDFDPVRLAKRVSQFADDYNGEVSRYLRKKPSAEELDSFLKTERVKWSRNLKSELKRGRFLEFDKSKIRQVSYRPFTHRQLYLDDIAVDEPAHSRLFAPQSIQHAPAITLSDVGHRADFAALMVNGVHDLHLCASSDAFQAFPLFTYDAEGGHRRDNVTDWALEQFRARYPKVKVTKKDIFHYVYAVLHHPAYREKYAANLRRELPRIPFAEDFAAFAKAGETLAALHTGYESQKEYKLKRVETPGVKPDWRVERMKLSKDKRALIYNDWLTLEGLPAEAHDYRLGNRSALDWIVDQYQVERSKENPDEILSDPNRVDDEDYIVRLIGQVVTVSVETMKLVRALPPLETGAAKPGYTQADLDAAHVYVAEEKE